ncbi:MAG: helix-turn-helix transcriptional regulator [Paludibaculum sp.]
MHPRTALVLSHGQFLGACASKRETDGFALSELTPTVPPEEVARHTHEDAHFVLLLDGTYLSTAVNAPPICRPPLLIYNPPGTTHRDRFQALEGRFLTISVSGAGLQRVRQFLEPLDRPAAFREGAPLQLAQRLFRECRRWDRVSPLAAEGLCLELMAEMARAAERRHRQPPSWLKTARTLIHDRCAETISVSEIAQAVGVHPVHLARTFREFFQCTPGDYLRHCRLEHAAGLLRRPDRPIAEVALDAGFADQSHFSKAFRKVFAVSPSEYRRAHVAR